MRMIYLEGRKDLLGRLILRVAGVSMDCRGYLVPPDPQVLQNSAHILLASAFFRQAPNP